MQRISDAQVAAYQATRAEQVADALAAQALAAADSPPAIEHGALTRALADTRVLVYRGMPFAVPPVPYREGARLQEIRTELNRLSHLPTSPETLALFLAQLEAAAALFPRLVTPAGRGLGAWCRRRVWRIVRTRWNPFADPSEGEVADLLQLFSVARTASSVQVPTSAPVRYRVRASTEPVE